MPSGRSVCSALMFLNVETQPLSVFGGVLFIFRVAAEAVSRDYLCGIDVISIGSVVGACSGNIDLIIVSGDRLTWDVYAGSADIAINFLGDAIEIFDVPEIIKPDFSVNGIIF